MSKVRDVLDAEFQVAEETVKCSMCPGVAEEDSDMCSECRTYFEQHDQMYPEYSPYPHRRPVERVQTVPPIPVIDAIRVNVGKSITNDLQNLQDRIASVQNEADDLREKMNRRVSTLQVDMHEDRPTIMHVKVEGNELAYDDPRRMAWADLVVNGDIDRSRSLLLENVDYADSIFWCFFLAGYEASEKKPGTIKRWWQKAKDWMNQ